MLAVELTKLTTYRCCSSIPNSGSPKISIAATTELANKKQISAEKRRILPFVNSETSLGIFNNLATTSIQSGGSEFLHNSRSWSFDPSALQLFSCFTPDDRCDFSPEQFDRSHDLFVR